MPEVQRSGKASMRWIKHMTASHDDEKVADLIQRYGHAGYGTWWLVVEIVAARLEADGNPQVTYSVTKWSHLLSLRGSHVVETLMRLVVTHLVTMVRLGDDITVTIPNLLKYRDEYSRKSGQAPDNSRTKKQIQIQKQKLDTHTEEIPSVRAAAPILKSTVRAADLNGQTSQRFDEFWNRYPRQQHRDAACHEWLSVVTVESEPQVFACLGRYLASDEVSRGAVANPEKWLMEQYRDGWAGTWPARAAPNGAPKTKQQQQADEWREL